MSSMRGEDEATRLVNKLGPRVCRDSPLVAALLDSVRWHGLDTEDALVAMVRCLVAQGAQSQAQLVSLALRLPPPPIVIENPIPSIVEATTKPRREPPPPPSP